MILAVNELLRLGARAEQVVADSTHIVSEGNTAASEVAKGEAEDVKRGSVVRVLWLSPNSDDVVVMTIDQVETTPTWMTKTQLTSVDEGGSAELIHDDPLLRFPAEDQISAKAKRRRDSAWGIIEPLLKAEPAIYQPATRGELIRGAAERSGRPTKSIRRWLREYWRHGMTKNALLTDWDKCGNRGQIKQAGLKKRGRPRTLTATIGVNVGEAMRRIFKVAIANYYLGKPKASLESAYNTMLRKHFADLVEEDKQGRLRLRSPDEIPTIEQFRYWYEKGRDLKTEAQGRGGRVYYEKTLRPLLGNSTVETFGPGARFQIDATVANVYLVSRSDPTRIVGRPIVYVVIDVWSRMIVGIYVGIERASWTTAMMAIANTAADKVAFCAEYGIQITPDMWPCRHLPATLLGDRGEMEATLVERLIARLNITVENTPPYRADWKGIVERRFLSLQVKYQPFVPGYIEPDFEERGGHDYRLDATLDIRDFTKIMIHAVLEHNGALIDGYPIDPELVRDGIPSVPNALWAWGIRNRSGRLRSYPEKVVKFALLPTATATVTRHGIEFLGRCYSCEYVLQNRWLERAGQKGSWKVDVAFDPRNLDEIHLSHPSDSKAFLTCTLTTAAAWGQGLSMQEVGAVLADRAKLDAGARHGTREGAVNRDHHFEAIVNHAIDRKAAAGVNAVKQSKASQTVAIRANNATERGKTQIQEAFQLSPSQAAPKAPVVPIRSPASTGYAAPNVFDLQMEEQ